MIFKKNQSLLTYNTFGLNYQAKYFATFNSTLELKKLLSQAKKPILILGGGSNILLTKNFEGTVLKNNIQGLEIVEENDKHLIVKVGAGEIWHDFVIWSIEQKLNGIENLSLIPGNVGAAPMQNIGAYGVEVESVFERLDAINIANLENKNFQNHDCEFNYRSSIFKTKLKDKYVITHVYFKLNKSPALNISYGAIKEELKNLEVDVISTKAVSDAVIKIRKKKLPDPLQIGNSGSFFKNPIISNIKLQKLQKIFPDIITYKISEEKVKVAAGWLIEKAGLKGYRNGDAGVYKNQALVLVNYGAANGQEILAISKNIQKTIKDKFDIHLEPEVNII